MEEPANWTIQKIEIRDTVPIEKAHQIYKKITGKKPRKIRESKNFFQFRVVPPTKFEKRSFRTKVVNNNIRIVFGIIKEEHKHLVGGSLWDYFTKGYDYVANKASGAFDYIKNSLSITDFSTKTKANLDKYGDYPITAIQLRRVPIAGALDLALQGVSAGEWERLKEKYGFDKFYHLSMVVTLRGAKDIVLNTGRKMKVAKQLAIEKLEVVSVNENIEKGEGMETQEVPLAGKSFSINDMFKKARETVGDTKFFAYSALGHNNCQDFISILLETQGLYREPERLFVYQDLSELVKELPAFTKAFSQGVTYIGALANKHLGVGGNRITLDHLVGGVYIPKDEFVKEHKHLVGLLNKSGLPELKKEADKQEAELKREGSGNQKAGFIRAMMARDNAEAKEQKEYVSEAGQSNKDKFKTLDERGFNMNLMTKTTHDVARKKKALTRNQAIKRFYDYVIANAPQHQPLSEGRTNYRKTYDLDRMFDEWKNTEGVEVREGRRQRREAQEEVFPEPEPQPLNARQQLAQQYDTIAKARGLRKDDARAVFRQLGGNPRVEGNNDAYRPVAEVHRLIVEYANRILN
jgi:hypothetical protein